MKLKYYFQINWLKTFYINFSTLPLKSAIKLPIVLFYRTVIRSLKGKIIIDAPVSHGMIKIGRADVSHWQYAHTILDINGMVHFAGKATVGRGSALVVNRGGKLVTGKKFRITAGTTILCEKSITFGDNFLSSWDNLIMDSDHHDIFSITNEPLNSPQPVTIGNHVWLGCRCTLLKGSVIPDDCVVASGSVITKAFSEKSAIIGGNGKNQLVLKSNIIWRE